MILGDQYQKDMRISNLNHIFPKFRKYPSKAAGFILVRYWMTLL